MELLERSDHSSYCSDNGDASYSGIPAGGGRSVDEVQIYEAVSEIMDHLAFDHDRVASII